MSCRPVIRNLWQECKIINMIQVSSDVTSISTKTKYTDFCVTCANEDIGSRMIAKNTKGTS